MKEGEAAKNAVAGSERGRRTTQKEKLNEVQDGEGKTRSWAYSVGGQGIEKGDGTEPMIRHNWIIYCSRRDRREEGGNRLIEGASDFLNRGCPQRGKV